MAMYGRLVSRQAAMAELGLRLRTLERRIADKKIQAFKQGRRVWVLMPGPPPYRVDELEQQFDDLMDQLAELERVLAHERTEHAGTTRKLDRAHARIAQLEEHSHGLAQEIEQERARVSQKSDEVYSLGDRINALTAGHESQIKEMTDDHERQLMFQENERFYTLRRLRHRADSSIWWGIAIGVVVTAVCMNAYVIALT